MKSELIVDVQPGDVSFALLEDSRLVSLQKEARDLAYAVGDIYLAKVKKLMPGLNAAFVNVGYEKDAFLHYLDLGPRFSTYSEFMTQLLSADKKSLPSVSKMRILPEIDKHGSITSVLETGRELMVQIAKEPISSKGPRLSTEIAFTGRFLVLQPFCEKISISQKIKTSEERMRLRGIVESIKPKNFGVIVRTSAEGKRSAELDHELRTLLKSWEDTVAKARTASSPALIFEEDSRVVGMLRDIFNPTFENIYVNDAEVFSQIQKYVTLIAPDKKDIVKLYERREPIFDHFNITRQIKSSFGKTVSFKNGAYIIIEHTEALHVIDVNSGNRTKADSDQETNALEVNLRAAEEIARQLRLRDMGGIIVVDFIDMAKSEHRQQLFDHMRELMAKDRARHNILPLSKFGLMQITRQRVRPALDITTTETCPSCFGKGEVQPSILFTDTLFEKLDFLVNNLEKRDFVMYIHPFVDAYIKKGLFTSLYGSWRRKLGRIFKIMPDQSLAYLQYRVVDKDGTELQLVSEKDSNSSSEAKSKDKARKRGGEDEAETTPQQQQQPKKQRLIDQPREILSSKKKEEKKAAKAAAKQQKIEELTAAKKPEQAKPQPKNKALKRQSTDEAKASKEAPAQEKTPAKESDTKAARNSDEAPAKTSEKKPRPQRPSRTKAAENPSTASESTEEQAANTAQPIAAETGAQATAPAEKSTPVALLERPRESDNAPVQTESVPQRQQRRQRPSRKPRAAAANAETNEQTRNSEEN